VSSPVKPLAIQTSQPNLAANDFSSSLMSAASDNTDYSCFMSAVSPHNPMSAGVPFNFDNFNFGPTNSQLQMGPDYSQLSNSAGSQYNNMLQVNNGDGLRRLSLAPHGLGGRSHIRNQSAPSNIETSMALFKGHSRKRSLSSINSADANMEDGPVSAKRLTALERNRMAALKCRQKKKDVMDKLEAEVAKLNRENEELKKELSMYRSQSGHLQPVKE
jgi:bZIP transcription factor